MTLKSLLEEAVLRYGTQKAVAQILRLNQSRFSAVLSSQDDRPQSFEIVTCLRLAIALGRPARDVLIAARKADTVPLFEQLFGAGLKPTAPVHPNLLLEVSPDERDVIEALRAVKRGGA